MENGGWAGVRMCRYDSLTEKEMQVKEELGVAGSPAGSDRNKATCNAGDGGSTPWAGKIP